MAKKTIMESVEEFIMGVPSPAKKAKKPAKKAKAKTKAAKKTKAKKTKKKR